MNVVFYALRRALKGMDEHRFLSVATASAVATVLLLTGAFLLVLSNLSGVMDRWGKDVQISCYLVNGLEDDRLFELKAELESHPEVASVTYVDPREAMARFGESVDGMERILADLDSNPLPASLEVRLHATHQQPESVAKVANAIARPEFVDMDYSQEWVERYHTFLALLRLSALVLGGLLLVSAAFLVSNTIRLAIYSRRDELAIISLVGGTRWFGRLPFLLEGAIQGLAGAALALSLLVLLYRYAFVQVQASLGMILGPDVLHFLRPEALLGLCLAGVAVGFLGALTSVMRAVEEGL